MDIAVLAENTAVSEEFGCEHSYSLYIATAKHKILFDVGASGLFIESAKKMEIDLADVDIVVISHGHYDHGGGLEAFLSINTKAKIYMNRNAFGKYYAMGSEEEGKTYIGLDERLLPNDRFVFTQDKYIIDESVELFSGVTGGKYLPPSNKDLYMELGGTLQHDDFAHEQNMAICEGDTTALFVGCAHKGIVNILERYGDESGRPPEYVFGGFHLMADGANEQAAWAMAGRIAEFMNGTKATYYTGHCTGINAYAHMKQRMADKVEYLSTGSRIQI
ncbi:MAG: MBL fold metallo-hydrolase [Christensenellaceae bacterium]|jgi:7,8-dihydropterin-6-yl-methyl-4-(beta-D-ribofuranosyl)aminobenzene 5'-phosphate synthase